MADSSHLEKMGRELKCPICLDLLDSAVSLTCNHVFCKFCIHKSMKSVANCPVCKVPYQRREIRPAPHMDNLVNIYKNMEVATGLSQFVTQNAPTRILDTKKQTDEALEYRKDQIDEEAPQIVKDHQENAETSKMSKSKAKHSGRSRAKSSFSMNKRVQMPQSPSTDTPLRQAKQDLKKSKLSDNVMNNTVVPPSEHQHSNEKESQGFAPFFWLRDDDEDKLSQQTDGDQLTCTPVKVPSFSDIKDSDDDEPTKLLPKAPIRKCVNEELFDSEMFEWTQRPCSPELCLSPSKMQGDEREAYDGMGQNELVVPLNEAVIVKQVTTEQLYDVNPQRLNNCTSKPQQGSSPGGSDHSQNKCELPQKRTSKRRNTMKRKRQIVNVDSNGETRDGSNSTSDVINKGQKPESKFALDSSKLAGTSRKRSVESSDTVVDKLNELVAFKSPASESQKGTCEYNTLENARRNSKRVKKSPGSNLVKTRKQKRKLTKADDNGQVTVSRDKKRGETSLESTLFNEKSVGKPSSGPETSNCTSSGPQVTVTVDGNKGVPAEVAAPAKNSIQEVCSNNNLGVSLKTRNAHIQKDIPALRKCKAIANKCAFCHSTEETEASGEMVHYAQGKPVSATHSGETVIHSHKSCAEWAPNVYFDDDVAVNLEEELVRSRRIKCSLCGVKGAALGCYEKSCRKSFHVPCAKKLRECRWDTDHFVILCPLHISSKLPCELPRSQVQNGTHNLNGKILNQKPQSSIKHANTSRWGSGRSSEKIVLCGSALATDEKDAVSEFAKLSGVALSARWDPSVTHVVASTNENGECRRTVKVLKGILEGKWILSIKWVQACRNASRLVEETPYEISCDIYGVKNGPYLGRLRLLNKQPKLFSGFKFYLTGDFEHSYIGYLQDLITAAGGTILHRKPIAEDSKISTSCSSVSPTVIIYAEHPDKCHPSRKDLTLGRRQSDAEALASSSGAKLAHDMWVFNCIAGHKVQGL